MASPAQVKANRANSKRSTGPRTAEGKARSSRNGTSHGLSAADVVVFPGEEQAFADLRTNLMQTSGPPALIDLKSSISLSITPGTDVASAASSPPWPDLSVSIPPPPRSPNLASPRKFPLNTSALMLLLDFVTLRRGVT